MNDKEFLIWIHERLHHVHGESECVDYMHKLRAIIKAYPDDKVTENILISNSMEEMLEKEGTVSV